MKPRTKLEVDVFTSSKYLSLIGGKHQEFAESILRHVGYATKYKMYCTECGTSYEKNTHKNTKKCICENCSTELEIEFSAKKLANDVQYFCIVDTYCDYQVFRYIYAKRISKRFTPAEYFISEVIQKWVKDGKTTVLGKDRIMQGSWSHYTELSIKKQSRYQYSSFWDVRIDAIYPVQRWQQGFNRYNINTSKLRVDPLELIQRGEYNPHIETLLKAGQYRLAEMSVNGDAGINDCWDSIKICMRNNYIVSDAGIYIDYLKMLRHFRKDVRNAHYVCPKNLKKAHDYYTVKRKKELDKQEKERNALELLRQKEVEQKFINRISKFIDIVISDKEITITPLKSLAEFKQEGEIMHHCVFSNKYYEQESSLILSARIDGKPIETIEIDLDTCKIVQSRGVCNGLTKYHNQIIKLVNNNINLIRQRMTA